MIRIGSLLACTAFAAAQAAWAQLPPQMQQMQRISADEAFDRAEKNNVLTSKGKPFHAILRIAEQKGDPAYSGTVDLTWAAPSKYKLVVSSPAFTQTLIANGSDVQETDTGDFYPQWLHGFVLALMQPMPREQDLRGRGQVTVGEHSRSCVDRNDKVNGVRNDLTWASVCFAGPDATLDFVIDFTYNMEFHDYQRFGKKLIARTYVSGEGDHARPEGKLVTLDELKQVDEELFHITKPTLPADRIVTTLVSSQQAQSMQETAPLQWPNPHEGPLSGFLIVHAVTDRTGQVRETSKYNSDNAEMESYAREAALRYKFKPLIVDGAPQQMSMPLVMHFEAKRILPYRVFTDAETRQRVLGCTLPTSIHVPQLEGKTLTLEMQVVEDGGISTIGSSPDRLSPLGLFGLVRSCRFPPYLEDGKPVRFRANFDVLVK